MAATNPDSFNANPNTNTGARESLMAQLKLFGMFATTAAQRGVVFAARRAMPLMRGYIGCDEVARIREMTGSPDDTGAAGHKPDQLSAFERATFNSTVHKATAESIHLATLAYPVEGIDPYNAVKDDNGCYPPPHLGHLLSVNKAVQDLLGDGGSAESGPSDAELAQRRPVLLTSLSANEYGYLEPPLDPKTIRRVALNEREMMFTNQG